MQSEAAGSASATTALAPVLGWLLFWFLCGIGGVLVLCTLAPDGRSKPSFLWSCILGGFLLGWFAGLLVGLIKLERARPRKPLPAARELD
jgi:hypothetical protein